MASKSSGKVFEVFFIAAVSLAAYLAWETVFVYPFKVLAVLIHEISHGFAAALTGGAIRGIEFYKSLGGSCITSGGNKAVIASAGYLGSLLGGSAFFFTAYDKTKSSIFCTSVSVILLLITASFIQNTFAIIFTLSVCAVLFISPRYFNSTVHIYLMKITGLITAFYVVYDIKTDLLSKSGEMTDAVLLSGQTGISAFIIALIWLVLSIVVIFLMFRFSIRKS